MPATPGVTLQSSGSGTVYSTIQLALDAAQLNDTATVQTGYTGSATGTVTSDGLIFSAPSTITGIQLALGTSRFSATDVLDLSLAGDAAIQVTGNTSDNVITGNTGADTLIGGLGNDLYTVVGTGTVITEASGGGSDTVATALSSFALSSNIEFLNGTGSGQTLTGNGLSTVTAGSGNDTLISGGAADTLIGGLGNDTYVVTNAAVTVKELTNGGTDVIQTALSTYNLASANVEVLQGTSTTGQTLSTTVANTTVRGGIGNDNLTTTRSDTIILDGGAGNDVFSFSSIPAGGDTIIGGAGSDTFDLSGAGAFNNVDAVSGETVAEGDYINGSGATDYISVNAGDTVFGNAGDDVVGENVNSLATLINGGTNTNGFNRDSIQFNGSKTGGGRITPLAGSIVNVETFILDTGSAGHQYDFSNVTQGAQIQLTGGGVGPGIYAIDVIGTSGNDTISPSGNGDTLAGGAGTDLFFGGVDDFIGSKITDIATGESIRFKQGSGAPNTITSAFTASLSGTTLTYDPDGSGSEPAQTLTLSNGAGGTIVTTFTPTAFPSGSYATVTFSAGSAPPPPPAGGGGGGGGGGGSSGGGGSTTSTSPSNGPDQLTGTSGDDTIVGMDGADTINGGDGNDLIFGNQQGDIIDAGSGNNTAYGGMGDDSVTAGAGNDLIFGNEGSDTINAGDGDNTIVGGQDSTDSGDLIVTGNGNDLIISNGGNDSVSAGAGNDSLVGGFGNDILFGNQGDDLILGNEDNDEVFGGFGNDTIFGGMGDDTLIGGEGNDVLFGNEGADRLVFGTNSGSDLVNGFSQAEGDRLDLQGQTYTTAQDANGNAVLTLSGGGMVTLAGIAANQVGAGFFA
jgi:Ca2+-binding RTX toxin-like protein